MLSIPLVSIGVPTYNRPEGLKRTLESLIKQTYSNIEIVISDNCSTNADVEKVIDKFLSDKRIKYFKQPINKGAAYNFSFVLDKSTGKYFKFLADDDWLDNNYVESCLTFLEENADYSVAYGIGNLISIEGEFIRLDPKMDIVFDQADKRVKYYYEKVLYNSPFYGIFRKEQFLTFFSIGNAIALDWVIIARFAFIGKCKLIEKTNSYISTGGVSSTTDNITASFNMPIFTKSYPFLQVAINVFNDIVWNSPAYKSLSFKKRLLLARFCFLIIYKRFSVSKNLWKGTKKFAKLMFGFKKNLT